MIQALIETRRPRGLKVADRRGESDGWGLSSSSKAKHLAGPVAIALLLASVVRSSPGEGSLG